MRTNRHHFPATRSGRGLVLLLTLATAATLVAQIQQGSKGSAWKFPEYYEIPLPGKSRSYPLKSLISGDEGRHLSNSFYTVAGMRIEHYEWGGATNLLARAPQCLFNMDTRVAWSTGRLEIVGMGGALTIEGKQGFEARMTNSTMTISNRVRTLIRQELLTHSTP